MEEIEKAVILALFLVIAISSLSAIGFSEELKKFEVDSVLLKVTLKQGQTISRTVRLTNIDSISGDFVVEIKDTNLFLLGGERFTLASKETRDLEIYFDAQNKGTGVDVSEILISSAGKSIVIPVIFEVETKEVLFDSTISVPSDYAKVYSGEQIIIENNIFNLGNIGAKNVEVEYIVKDFKGKTIFSDKENVVVETKILVTKTVFLPEDTYAGNYVFIIITRYSDSFGASTYFFKVDDKSKLPGEVELYTWIAFILIIAIICFFIYYLRQKDKVFLELARLHKQELKREIEKLEKEKQKEVKKLNAKKKKVKLREFAREKKRKIKVIKKLYKIRVKKLKKLKKQKKKSEMQRKLSQWKKEGYNIREFSELRPQKNEIRKQAAKLKKQGYKM